MSDIKSNMDEQEVQSMKQTVPSVPMKPLLHHIQMDDILSATASTDVKEVSPGINRLKLYTWLHAELNHEHIEQHMRLLRNWYPNIHGMQATVLGSYRKNYTVPLITSIPLNMKFVQPLNVGDHCTTVTNVFSSRDNEIQLHDSSYRTLNSSTILHCSSLAAQTLQRKRHNNYQHSQLRPTDVSIHVLWPLCRSHLDLS